MEEIENLIVEAEWDGKKWETNQKNFDKRGMHHVCFDDEITLLNHFGNIRWRIGAITSTSFEISNISNIRKKSKYYFWRPK